MKPFKKFLNAKTPSIEKLAQKHNMSVADAEKLVAQGAEIESEHTKHKEIAREIAIDHLNEKPDYYKKLKKYVE